MKKITSMLFLFVAAILVLTSCGEEETPDSQVSISGIPPTATIDAGATLGPVIAQITAPDGLASLTVRKDGATLDTENFNGATSASYEFSYTAVAADAGNNVVFEFEAVDSDGSRATVTHVLTVREAETTVRVTTNIEGEVTWTADKTYILGGRIFVVDGGKLTIEAGTIIKGEAGSGSNATALVVARGGQIFANGTAEAPIIFTSIADEIEAGMIASPNLDADISGLWGGLIVLGRAPSSFAGDVSEVQIEGIPPSDTNGRYGGNIADDNSGVIRYISIRHGGANIGEGNEINGLTLGAVGSGTVVENVEVIGNQDDGIEWFGGTVNVKNAIVWNSGDDALDTDQAWSGTMDNFIIISGSETDHALEIDGPEGSFNAAHTLRNGTIVGHPAAEMGDFRDGARGTFENLYFIGFPDPVTSTGRGDLSISGDASLANLASGVLLFNNIETTLATGVPLNLAFRNGVDSKVTAVAANQNTVGANKAVFAGWSWTAVAGNLDDLK
ncbi:hypothetical protein Belba_0797 [Belliella baltica DSM 15883]|uniref:Uncharacterized protein n=1 Tax=Belliella baltica (strain DSM 15883 / CIP 108006 / LMG 21964 / BA134) TaxID=866536 RepID=I3Z2H7_BELBD|nr:hypothetical protein [Belliella baltica]AFL83445.1 hypothetical protein Belba_0797 [Belliella baltica DSM 15883]